MRHSGKQEAGSVKTISNLDTDPELNLRTWTKSSTFFNINEDLRNLEGTLGNKAGRKCEVTVTLCTDSVSSSWTEPRSTWTKSYGSFNQMLLFSWLWISVFIYMTLNHLHPLSPSFIIILHLLPLSPFFISVHLLLSSLSFVFILHPHSLSPSFIFILHLHPLSPFFIPSIISLLHPLPSPPSFISILYLHPSSPSLISFLQF